MSKLAALPGVAPVEFTHPVIALLDHPPLPQAAKRVAAFIFSASLKDFKNAISLSGNEPEAQHITHISPWFLFNRLVKTAAVKMLPVRFPRIALFAQIAPDFLQEKIAQANQCVILVKLSAKSPMAQLLHNN